MIRTAPSKVDNPTNQLTLSAVLAIPVSDALPEVTTAGENDGGCSTLGANTARNKKKRAKLKAKKAALKPNALVQLSTSISTPGYQKTDGALKRQGEHTFSPDGVSAAKQSRQTPIDLPENTPQDAAKLRDDIAGPFLTKIPDPKRLNRRAWDNLAVLIYDKERGRIEEPESEEILSKIISKILELPDDHGMGNIGCSGPPVLENGKITVFCANAETRNWLISVVGSLGHNGRDLQATRWDEWEEDMSKIRIYFPVNPGSPDQMLMHIEKQNACVRDTSQWKVVTCNDANGGVGKLAVVLLPKEAAEAVRVAGNKLFCLFMTAKVSQCRKGSDGGGEGCCALENIVVPQFWRDD